jgi:hypothetical protein
LALRWRAAPGPGKLSHRLRQSRSRAARGAAGQGGAGQAGSGIPQAREGPDGAGRALKAAPRSSSARRRRCREPAHARQRSLVDQDREFQRKRREFQEDLNARKNEELQQVYERANRVVKQVAEAEKYDAILQEAIYINPSTTSPRR